MQIIVKPSAAIRQNYAMISNLCKETAQPVFLTKNGKGDLVVMDIDTFCRREELLDLREQILEIEEHRKFGKTNTDVEALKERLKKLRLEQNDA